MALSASGIQSDIAAFIAAYGEPLTFNTGGVTTGVTAFCLPASRGAVVGGERLDDYFDDNELVALTLPALVLYLGGTVTPPTVGATTFLRDGRYYTVRKVAFQRVSSTVVVTLAFGD